MEGWAIYNGEIRNGSNHEGIKYGTKIKANDIIGVLLDTLEVSRRLKFNQ